MSRTCALGAKPQNGLPTPRPCHNNATRAACACLLLVPAHCSMSSHHASQPPRHTQNTTEENPAYRCRYNARLSKVHCPVLKLGCMQKHKTSHEEVVPPVQPTPMHVMPHRPEKENLKLCLRQCLPLLLFCLFSHKHMPTMSVLSLQNAKHATIHVKPCRKMASAAGEVAVFMLGKVQCAMKIYRHKNGQLLSVFFTWNAYHVLFPQLDGRNRGERNSRIQKENSMLSVHPEHGGHVKTGYEEAHLLERRDLAWRREPQDVKERT